MLRTGIALTAIHALVAFSLLYDLVAAPVARSRRDARAKARPRLMTFWTIAIAYRRFQQGVLIRFGHALGGVGTMVRLGTPSSVTGRVGDAPARHRGSTIAVASGVLAEVLYAGWRVHPVLAKELPRAT
jgi:hypothetical protein